MPASKTTERSETAPTMAEQTAKTESLTSRHQQPDKPARFGHQRHGLLVLIVLVLLRKSTLNQGDNAVSHPSRSSKQIRVRNHHPTLSLSYKRARSTIRNASTCHTLQQTKTRTTRGRSRILKRQTPLHAAVQSIWKTSLPPEAEPHNDKIESAHEPAERQVSAEILDCKQNERSQPQPCDSATLRKRRVPWKPENSKMAR